MRLRSVVALLFVAPVVVGAIGAIAATSQTSCYAPTEVTVTFTTDLGCKAPFHTAIYKGAPSSIDSDPQTDTQLCTEAASASEDARIGTLVFVPSGSADGNAAVRAILTLNDKSPALCATDPTDCIIATRQFSFVAHESRKIPIRLLRECLNARCPEGFTCVGLNQCARPDCPAGDENCNLAPDPDAGSPPVSLPSDGGPEPSTDGGGDAGAGILCDVAGGKKTLVTGVDGDVVSVLSQTGIYWTTRAGGGATHTVEKISTLTGQKTTITDVVGYVYGFGLNGETTLVGHDGLVSGQIWVVPPGTDVTFPNNNGHPNLLIGTGGVGPEDRVLVATDTQIFNLNGLGGGGTDPSVTPIAMANNPTGLAFLGLSLSGGLGQPRRFAFSSTDGLLVVNGGSVETVPGGAASALLTTTPTGRVIAAGSNPTGNPLTTYTIQELLTVAQPSVTTILSMPKKPSALAADEQNVYWVQSDDRIVMHPLASTGNTSQVVPNELGNITSVMLDANCIYYWARLGKDANAKSVLKTQKKTGFGVAIDGGI